MNNNQKPTIEKELEGKGRPTEDIIELTIDKVQELLNQIPNSKINLKTQTNYKEMIDLVRKNIGGELFHSSDIFPAIQNTLKELKKEVFCMCEIHKIQHSKHEDCPDGNCLVIKLSDVEEAFEKVE